MSLTVNNVGNTPPYTQTSLLLRLGKRKHCHILLQAPSLHFSLFLLAHSYLLVLSCITPYSCLLTSPPSSPYPTPFSSSHPVSFPYPSLLPTPLSLLSPPPTPFSLSPVSSPYVLHPPLSLLSLLPPGDQNLCTFHSKNFVEIPRRSAMSL